MAAALQVSLRLNARWHAPELAGLIAVAVVFLLMVVLPFVDRSKERNPLRKPVTTSIALILVIGLIALTIWGAVSS